MNFLKSEIRTNEIAHPCGLMLHHMTDGKHHPKIQGALTKQQLWALLTGKHGCNFLSAAAWFDAYGNGELRPNDMCITFDDSLLSQYDIALPVLEELGLTAIWFVYSGVFEGVSDDFELHRYFRNTAFSSANEFYDIFFDAAHKLFPERRVFDMARKNEAAVYLGTHHFYTLKDRQFRYIRDIVLTAEEFNIVMTALIKSRGAVTAELRDKIWMRDEHLRRLSSAGHVIGLHSYSHPVNLRRLSLEEQISEYHKNAVHLTKVLGYCPDVMAHPSNSYDETTLRVLRGMGIKFGFRSDYFCGVGSDLEIRRLDHTIFGK